MKFVVLCALLSILAFASTDAAGCVSNRACILLYAPVCGSDGVTYGNQCMFDAQKADCDPSLTVVNAGPCAAK